LPLSLLVRKLRGAPTIFAIRAMVAFAYLGGHVGTAGSGVPACRRPFLPLPPQGASAGGGQLRSARKWTIDACGDSDPCASTNPRQSSPGARTEKSGTLKRQSSPGAKTEKSALGEDWRFNAEPTRRASPRAPPRIWSLPHLAMAAALFAASFGAPSASVAEVANPVKALSTTISKTIAPAIPKIDPVGWLDDPVQPNGPAPAAKAAAGGKAGGKAAPPVLEVFKVAATTQQKCEAVPRRARI